eukprot:scaffold135994_cov184-Phaeocystis_antarctica.AAC.1
MQAAHLLLLLQLAPPLCCSLLLGFALVRLAPIAVVSIVYILQSSEVNYELGAARLCRQVRGAVSADLLLIAPFITQLLPVTLPLLLRHSLVPCALAA